MVKPQFFEAYRAERDATSLLDVAAGYLTKKAVAASKAYANGETLDEGSPWGGMASKIVLATETVPATVKIQALSRREWIRDGLRWLHAVIGGLWIGG